MRGASEYWNFFFQIYIFFYWKLHRTRDDQHLLTKKQGIESIDLLLEGPRQPCESCAIILMEICVYERNRYKEVGEEGVK